MQNSYNLGVKNGNFVLMMSPSNHLQIQDASSMMAPSMALSPKAMATSSSSILRDTLAILGAPLQAYVTIPRDSRSSIMPTQEDSSSGFMFLFFNTLPPC